MLAAPALADSDFYVEVGKDTTKEKAATDWKDLSAKYKGLSKLKYFPKNVIQGGTTVGIRMQAGPIADKAKAQKICSKLFKDNVPCFVIEGNGSAPTEVMNLSEKAETKIASGGTPSAGGSSWLPWLNTSEVNQPPPPPVQEAPAPAKESSMLPWLNQKPDMRKPQVQVAEAIRVPLTDNFDPNGSGKVTVNSLPDIKPTFRKQFAENNMAPAAGSVSGAGVKTGAGWLTLDTFANEDVATSFWEEAHSGLSKTDSKNLHVRVQKSLMSQSKAALSVGPFASNTVALAFCDKIQARDRGLNCNFEGTVASDTRGNAYNNRRMADSRRRPSENPYGAISPAAGPSKQYWVQVLSAQNQMEALRQWESMKSTNADVLNGMRSSVTTSPKTKDYVVRVGPIANNDDAIKFCGKLQDRGIKCSVLLYYVGL